MMRSLLVLLALVVASSAFAQAPMKRKPVIDMHLHAMSPEDMPNEGSASGDTILRATIAELERLNVVRAVTSGEEILAYQRAAPEVIIPGAGYGWLPDVHLDTLRAWFTSGRYGALSEFAPQYQGLAPADPQLEPYFALAEELDVPLGIHMGLGPPGAAYVGHPKYRMALSDPLLLEDVLIRHPKLRLYVMHAGWPMLDRMIGLLYAHPQVHVDLGVISWYVPRAEFHAYLRRIVEAGYGKRVMFGSDQMLWPETIGKAIEAVETAGFLTEEQKRDILCNNAARFLKLDENICQ